MLTPPRVTERYKNFGREIWGQVQMLEMVQSWGECECDKWLKCDVKLPSTLNRNMAGSINQRVSYPRSQGRREAFSLMSFYCFSNAFWFLPRGPYLEVIQHWMLLEYKEQAHLRFKACGSFHLSMDQGKVFYMLQNLNYPNPNRNWIKTWTNKDNPSDFNSNNFKIKSLIWTRNQPVTT